jgi:hypothetical protein
LRASAGAKPVPNAGSAPGGSYRGYDFRAAYAPGVVLTGAGQIVGLVEFDGYYTNDINAYASTAGLPKVPLKNVLLNGFNGAAGANNVEVALDIEVAFAMAPGLAGVWVYEGASANSILSQMATDNRAKQLSSSWTFGINATTENIFKQFATQGQTMFQASGDDGAYSGVVPTPADDPNLTVVGGTILTTSGPAGKWGSETTWNWAPSANSASSGGVSASYPIPAYQKNISMTSNGGSLTSRNVPDVALTADNVWVVWDNGSKAAFGGTSASTPLWAGFMALVNQQALANGRTPLGFLNPSIYAIGKSANFRACFHDTTTGNNFNPASPAKFAAVAGYDLCTGWGTPAGQPLINALAGGTNLPPFFKSNPFTGPPANIGQPLSASISNSATDANTAERLTFSKLSGPAWLTVHPNGSLSGTPANADVGQNAFLLSISASAGMSNTATMYLGVNGAPVFNSPVLFKSSVNAGQAYTASLSDQADDPNAGDQLIFAKLSGPAWLSVSASGGLTGTPDDSDAGTNVFTVMVADQGGLSNSATLYINVNGHPSFAGDPFTASAALVGASYSGSLLAEAQDPNPGSTLTFAKVSGPAWLVVAPDGSLSGMPTAADLGTNSFTVITTDSDGLTGTAQMNVPVTPASTLAVHLGFQAGQLFLDWAGGNPPFQVQFSTNLAAGIWQNLGNPITNRVLTVAPTTGTGAYRIQAAP